MIKQLSPYKQFGTPIKPRRTIQRISATERKILEFLLEKFRETPDGYFTFSADPVLLKVTGRSQSQLSRALRKLLGWKLLMSSGGGRPTIYHIELERSRAVRRVLENGGYISALLVLGWVKQQEGWFTSRQIARLLNVSKREAQKLLQILVVKGFIKRIHLSGRGFKGRVVYTESKDQIVLDHWMKDKSESVVLNIKRKIYGTENPFI